MLLIEVADSSLDYDRGVKGRLYARHEIGEFWIIDLERRQITVHRQPRNDDYASVSEVRPHETLTIAALPDIALRAADIFPD